MKLSPPIVMGLFLLTLTAPACQGASPTVLPGPDEPSAPATRPVQALPLTSPEVSTGDPSASDKTEPVPRELVESARLDLAGRLDIPPDLIGVAEAYAVEWPDASLGCPQPGMAYAAVITPGHRILLEAQGVQYPFHTDLAGNIILCENEPLISGSQKDTDSNVVDGWPNQTKDDDVLIVTPTPRK